MGSIRASSRISEGISFLEGLLKGFESLGFSGFRGCGVEGWIPGAS